jgi:argininosuccinate lyase
MWGGRFATGPAAIMEEINASIDFDRKLFAQDIDGSIAHATMLADCHIISGDDRDKIIHGLNTIRSEIEKGRFVFSRKLEDIHMNIEARLSDLIGPACRAAAHRAFAQRPGGARFSLWVRAEARHVRPTQRLKADRGLPRQGRGACKRR